MANTVGWGAHKRSAMAAVRGHIRLSMFSSETIICPHGGLAAKNAGLLIRPERGSAVP